VDFTIRPKWVLVWMLCVIALLATLHIAQLLAYYYIDDSEVFDFVQLIDFDYEGNLPSLYSHIAIFFAASLLWFIAIQKRKTLAAPYRYHWILLAVIFTFLGFDEALALHEEVGDLFEDRRWVDASGYLFFAWVVPYGVLLAIFVISYLRFVFALPRVTMLLFITAGTLFVGGAVGIEVFSAYEADLRGSETIMYSVLYTLEELCEMVGIALFCYALMRYIETEYGYLRIHFDSAER